VERRGVNKERMKKIHPLVRVTLRLHHHRRFVGKSVERYLLLPRIAAKRVIGNNDTAVSTEKARGMLRLTFVKKLKNIEMPKIDNQRFSMATSTFRNFGIVPWQGLKCCNSRQ
jgi:hypothetical protein